MNRNREVGSNVDDVLLIIHKYRTENKTTRVWTSRVHPKTIPPTKPTTCPPADHQKVPITKITAVANPACGSFRCCCYLNKNLFCKKGCPYLPDAQGVLSKFWGEIL